MTEYKIQISQLPPEDDFGKYNMVATPICGNEPASEVRLPDDTILFGVLQDLGITDTRAQNMLEELKGPARSTAEIRPISPMLMDLYFN